MKRFTTFIDEERRRKEKIIIKLIDYFSVFHTQLAETIFLKEALDASKQDYFHRFAIDGLILMKD